MNGRTRTDSKEDRIALLEQALREIFEADALAAPHGHNEVYNHRIIEKAISKAYRAVGRL